MPPQVPFILVEGEKWPQSDYVVVNMEGSNHPLPLTTVYQHLQPISATPLTFLQAICGLEYPVSFILSILFCDKSYCTLFSIIHTYKNNFPSGWNAL